MNGIVYILLVCLITVIGIFIGIMFDILDPRRAMNIEKEKIAKKTLCKDNPVAAVYTTEKNHDFKAHISRYEVGDRVNKYYPMI